MRGVVDLSHFPRHIAQIMDACRPWDGAIDGQGYPRCKVRGKSRYAHRLAYECFWGPLKSGERVYRTCGDRTCTNYYHLTTERPKTRRRRPASAKLNRPKVREIRRLWAQRPRPTQQNLAYWFGVSRSAISLVVRGQTWKTS